MPLRRARYVTLCQQSLVSAAVLAVGISAAGVSTLDIVPQPGFTAEQGNFHGGPVPSAPRAGERPVRSLVDATPVTPKVHEVHVSGIAAGVPVTPTRTRHRGGPPAGEVTAAPTPESTREAPRVTAGRTERDTVRPRGLTAGTTKRLVARSEPEPVHGYATVGVTWKHGVDYAENQVAVQIRTKTRDRWSDWTSAAYHDDHGPDIGSAEDKSSRERPGTDPIVVGDVDQVQMRAETTDGTTPPDLQLAVVDPGAGTLVTAPPATDTAQASLPPAAASASTGPAPASSASAGPGAASLSAMKVAPRPTIYSRAQWGANEKMRDQSAPSYGTVEAGFIHHTVNANTYTAQQVPALLRGIYAYHTQSRGWRDIGYNFLVDRFGRIWEGRYGGIASAVVGAHTLGFNEVSFAMSAIGNYDIAAPPQAVLSAYARLFAWKLSLYNIAADAAKVWVKGRLLYAINGHRDVGQTACPGRYLYAQIPYIRALARSYQVAAQRGTPTPVTPAPVVSPPAPAVFTSPTQTPRPATTQSAGIVFPRALNLTGDANPDLVLKSRSGAVQVIPTGGQTGFGTAVSTRGRWNRFDRVVAVGDVTGDGRGDVLARLRSNRTARIYRGVGDGHVSTSGIGRSKQFSRADLITAAGDWNSDGHNDVLMRTARTGDLWMVPGLGHGVFGKPVLLSRSWAGLSDTAVAGDLTADGRPDIVALHRNGYLYAAASTSTGRLTGLSRPVRVGTDYTSLVGAGRDMTGDGYGDVALRSARTGGVIILPGRAGGFGTPLGPFGQAAGLRKLSAGQMAGSAQPDLVGTNSRGSALLVVANNGDVNLKAPVASNLAVAGVSQILNVGDWNGDGHGDVITRQSGGDVLVLRPGLGTGRFGAGVVMSRGWRTFTRLAALGDVTGDGLPDLVGKTASARMTVFPGNGASGFKAPALAPSSLRTYNQIGAGAWKPAQLPGSAFLSPDRSFVPFTGTESGDLAGYDWVLGPGDVDGDGRGDLVVRDRAGTLWLLPGTASGYGARRVIADGFAGYSLGG